MTDQFLDRHAENLIKRLRSKHHDNISCKGRNPADYSTLEGEAADLIAALKAEIARLKSPWKPISTFPASGIYQAARYDDEFTDAPECLEMVWAPMLKDGRILNLNSGKYSEPMVFTHWCELPAPPAEGEKEEDK